MCDLFQKDDVRDMCERRLHFAAIFFSRIRDLVHAASYDRNLENARIRNCDQSSEIVDGPLPAVFSYFPLPTLRYCVKPFFARCPSRRRCEPPETTLGAPITRS